MYLPSCGKYAIKLQTGFIWMRQMLQNAIDLDFFGRADTLQYIDNYSNGYPEWEFKHRPLNINDLDNLGNIPILGLFDYAAAFPSVAHAWMFAILIHLGMPKGLLNAIETL